MTANPIDSAIVDNVNVSKSDTRGFVKDRLRQRFEDATEVRAASLSGQYGGIYLASLQLNFDLDPSDTTTADDGATCIIDADGNRFIVTTGITAAALFGNDNRVLRSDGTANGLQASVVTLDDTGNMSGVASLSIVAAPSIVHAPTGNPYSTVAALLVQGETATVDYTKRQFYQSTGFTSKNGALTFTANTSSNTTLSNLNPSATTLVARGLAVGAFVSDNASATPATGDIPLDAYITAINTGANTVTISSAATGTHTGRSMWATPTYLSDRVGQYVGVVGQDDSGTIWAQNITCTLATSFPKVVGGHVVEYDIGINNRDYDTISPSFGGATVSGYSAKRATWGFGVSGNKYFGDGSTVTGTVTGGSGTVASLSPTATVLVAAGLRVGDTITSSRLAGSVITAINTGANTVTVTPAASGSGAATESLIVLGPLFNYGVVFVNNSVRTGTIWDATNSTTSYLMAGAHDYGIDMSGATIATAAIRFASNQKLLWVPNGGGAAIEMLSKDTSDELVLGAGASQILLQKNAVTQSLIMANGTAVLTSLVAGNTARLQAFNTNTSAFVTGFTMTAGNPPTFDLSTTVTRGGNTILDSAALGVTTQAWDADLDALAALASTGIAARTASNTWAQRTLTAPAAGFTITNPAGVAGNPTFVLANDLGALEALASTGFAARTTTDTWAQRTLTAPAAGLTISNPAGVAGDPTFALANDLAALEALSGTSTIYYRSATDTWTAVTIDSKLGFSGGSLGSSLGTAAAQNTGTSGANIPFLNGANTWSGAQILSGVNLQMSNNVAIQWRNSTNAFYWNGLYIDNLDQCILGGGLVVKMDGPLTFASATAMPAGGSTTFKLAMSSTSGFGIYFGSGAPTISAAQGSLYLRSDGTSTTRLYVNKDGSTNWTAMNSVS